MLAVSAQAFLPITVLLLTRPSSSTNAIVAYNYTVHVTHLPPLPIISWSLGTSAFQQAFNPSWVDPSCGRSGLLVRAQNCTPTPGACTFCSGPGANASVLAFAEALPDGTYSPITAASVVLAPSDASDAWGTEDPRLHRDPRDGLYYLFYTAYTGASVLLSLATTLDPTDPRAWRRHGPVFPSLQGSKSAALLLRPPPDPHLLLWGAGVVRAARSRDPAAWPDPGPVILAPRPGRFDSLLVESGPPPLRLSTGDYLFFYNSASDGWPDAPGSGYHAGWAVLDRADPARVRQRAAEPLLGPRRPWERGTPPWACNAPAVVFLSAAAPLGGDRFRVYFGAADAVVGTAVVAVAAVAAGPPAGPPAAGMRVAEWSVEAVVELS
jgi:predicted GH43/DUF377 family glycosyl hydrolase